MRHLCLFSGIGGFALAATWAGYTTVQFVEIDGYCQRVLAKNFPGVPIHDDITTFDATGYRGTVDLLTGGFPCQPYSVAGQQRGAADDRALWPEMRRVIDEARPRWVVAENVPGFIGLGLDDLLIDLESLGYETGALVVPAAGVGAPHIRQRLWVVAHTDQQSEPGRAVDAVSGYWQLVPDPQNQRLQATVRQPGRAGTEIARSAHVREDVANSDQRGRQEQWQPLTGGSVELIERSSWWEVEPGMGRLVDGLPRGMAGHRVSQLKALGNAIVPAVAYEIIRHLETI